MKVLYFLSFLLFFACVSYSNRTNGLSLLDAIENSAEKIADELPVGSRVAIVAFESVSDNLSDYIMEELTGALIDRKIEVADRQNLEYVYNELNFQMSGDVSDESAQSIGKFLGAQLVITGQLTDIGDTYRFRISAIHTEKATRVSVPRYDVRNDRAMGRMVAAIANQRVTIKTAKYGVNENTLPQTAGKYLDRGILFASRSDYDQAIADFSEAIKIDPDLTAAYILRGRALYASISKVTSIESNFSSINTSATGGRASEEQILIYEKAIMDFNKALSLDPNNAKIYLQRGRAYSDKGDNDKAISDFNQALRLAPNDIVAYCFRALVYRQNSDYDRAIEDYTQALRLDPSWEDAMIGRGIAYTNKGDYDKAIIDFNQALLLNPNADNAYYSRGNMHYSNRNYDLAIADYTQAIRLSPNASDAYNNRGMSHWRKGDLDRAIVDFEFVLKLEPNHARAKNNIESVRQQVSRVNINSANAFFDRGNEYFQQNNFDRAIEEYSKALNLVPSFVNVLINRGMAYGSKGDYDKAINDFTQALKFDPNNANIFATLGSSYFFKGDINNAIANWETALRLNPNDNDARAAIERARQMQKQ